MIAPITKKRVLPPVLFLFLVFCAFLSLSGGMNALAQTKAATVSANDLINQLRLREAEIQDYKVIVARSFYHPAYSKEDAHRIAEDETNASIERVSEEGEKISDDLAQKVLFSQMLREDDLISNTMSGNLLFFEGIGIATWKYAICSFSNSGGEKEIESLFQSESFKLPSLEEINSLRAKEPSHELTLKQVLVNYPSLSMDSYITEEAALNNNVFTPNKDIVVKVRDKFVQRRSIEFPFWHETFLSSLDNAEIKMVAKPGNRYRLISTSVIPNTKNTKTYELVCDAEGYSYEIVYKVNDQTQWKGNYLTFMNVDNGGIRVPQTGSFWRPEYVGVGGPRTRETTEVHTLLSASVNQGRTVSDLAITVPQGSKIVDERPNGTRKSKNIEKTQNVGPENAEKILQD